MEFAVSGKSARNRYSAGLLASLLVLGGCFDSSGSSDSSDDGQADWASPDCDRVTGSALVTFSRDRGETLLPTDEGELPEQSASAENTGVTRFHQLPGVGGGMVSGSADKAMQVSHDSGCSWAPNESEVLLPGFYSGSGAVTTAGQYVFARYRTVEQGDQLYRVSLEGEREDLLSVDQVFQLGATEADPGSVYLRKPDPDSDQTVIWRSGDEGMNWTEEAELPHPFIKFLAVNSHDPLHFIGALGVTGQGGRIFNSHDGGVTWQEGGGFEAGANTTSIRSFDFGGSEDAGEIWLAVELGFTWQPELTGPVIYYSNDNGQTFTEVYRTAGTTGWGLIDSGAIMTTRPGTTGELYFTLRGCSMYRYRVEDDSLKEYTWDDRENIGVSAIMAHPADPDVIYVANGYNEDCE